MGVEVKFMAAHLVQKYFFFLRHKNNYSPTRVTNYLEVMLQIFRGANLHKRLLILFLLTTQEHQRPP